MYKTALSLVILALVPGTAVLAQSGSSGSRAVVQPLPSPAVGELNSALRRISRNARDVEALIDAGSASLRLDDIEAALGFYTRAREVQPSNAQASLGLANVYLRSDRPVEALQLFRAAEQSGASSQNMAIDRGLAFDLVGDNAAAQQEYSRALTGANADEARRRLALSQAIQGNREAFERTLYPLLEKQDFAAYRTRAFALAILGQEREAIAITEAVMPADLAARMAPYLNYMRRLTPAQQAAAANLGNFPRAAQIGRDDPRILAYREAASGVRSADASLAPSGPPLGAQVAAATGATSSGTSAQDRSDGAAQRRRPGRGASRAEQTPSPAPVQPAVVARADPAPTRAPDPQPAPAQAEPAPAVQLARAELPPAPSEVQPGVAQPVVQPAPVPTPTVSAPPVVTLPAASPAPAEMQTTLAAAQPGFDLAQVTNAQPASALAQAPVSTVAASEPPSAPTPTPAPTPAPAPAPAPLLPAAVTAAPAETTPARVADAFADLAATPSTAVARAPDAVDITRIKPPREVEKKPEPPAPKAAAAKPPPPPPHPSRHWVQLATGRDKAALRFDWRRFSGKAPDLLGKMEPHVAAWGQTNRLLAGPYDSPRAANAALAALKKAGLDGFTFTSDAGQEVDRLR